MNRLRWIGVRLIEGLGWPGTTGLVLLLGCGLYYLAALHPLQRKMDELRMAVISGKGAPGRDAVLASETELIAFRKYFEGKALEQQLKAIQEAGKTMGFSLKRIEYRMMEEPRAGLKQYQIVMPVTSSYPRVRQFVSLALSKVPAMSLDYVSFQRRKIGDGVVDVELRFTLFLTQPR